MRLCLVFVGLFLVFTPFSGFSKSKNLILFIGDGMGPSHIEATANYFEGDDSLFFQSFPSKGLVHTSSLDATVTDSAAAATAIATGVKTKNGMVGRNAEGEDLDNITYLLRKAGFATGVVTDVSISHATPAAFSGQADNREQHNHIIDSMLSRTRPDLLFGGAVEINPEWALYKGYKVVSDRSGLLRLLDDTSRFDRVSGQFGTHHLPWADESAENLPRLEDLTDAAIKLLSKKSDKGFFIMIEAGKIDWASHGEDLLKTVHEVKALEKAVKVAYDYARKDPNTLVLVTADHETGGLELLGAVQKGRLREHRWTGPDAGTGNVAHTGKDVGLFAFGQGHTEFQGTYENTEIFSKMKAYFELN